MTKARLLSNLVSNGQPLVEGFATQQYVDNKITQVVGAAPQALDTLKEIADQLAADESVTSGIISTLSGKANTSSLATVATSGSYVDLTNKPTLFSGSYTDLTNKPTLFNGSYNSLTDKPTLFSGSYTDLTNKPTLATVATSGSYVDLSNKPTLDTSPSITSLVYSANDLATDTTTPLPVTIIGSGFVTNTKVYIDTISNANSATALQFSGTTQITFTPPAKSAASYNVWVVTPDGKMAVLVNGILYSGTPSWAGVNTNYSSTTTVNIQLTATSVDTPLVYSLVSGTLPTGVTLSSSGLLSGNVTGLVADTSYPNIVINANDAQNQDANITIQLTINLIANISRSLRFNPYDSANLSRTVSTASNRTTWTWSGWVKRCNTSSSERHVLFGAYGAGNDTDWFEFGFGASGDTSDSFYWTTANVSGNTTAVFRDYSAWYHIVLSYNGSALTLYVNNTTYTLSANRTGTLAINGSFVHTLGKTPNSGINRYFDGYMAEVNFIDGLALTPSSFGQVFAQTGVWAPKRYTGVYGTNGFYLNFVDNSSNTATTLGKDTSGNSNNWTPNNFSVVAGYNNDSMVDSPTIYGTDTGVGGEVRGNYCTFSQNARSPSALVQDGNLYLTATNNNYHAALGTIGASSGKWYFEMQLMNGVAAPDIGFQEEAYTSSQLNNFDYATRPGSYCIATTGNGSAVLIFNNGTATQITNNGTTWATGDIIGCAIDMDAKKIWFHRNGTYYASSAGGTIGSPAAGTNPTMTYTYNGVLLPRGSGYGSGYVAQYNFGQRPFAYSAPSGFKTLCTQNLPIPTIGATSSTLANKNFNVYTWTGNGTNPRQHTGIGFQPDFVWIFRRDVGYGNWIYDSVRGATKPLRPNDTSAEGTYGQVGSFDADGFTQTGFEDQGNNVNGGQYIAFLLKGGGTGVSNTQGTITSTVSANTTAGFSIVKYTNAASGTVGHGLGIAPAVVIYKDLISGSNNWVVLHKSLGDMTNSYLTLNTTNTVNTGINLSAAPTSTVITTSSTLMGAGNAGIAYCFAEVPGFSKFGIYTGNGSAAGPSIYLGFRPAFIIVKAMTGTGSWCIFDTRRSTSNGARFVLQANNTSSEGTFTTIEAPDLISAGFKLNFSYADYNASNVQYIYMAFAETPFKHALAR